VRAATPAELLAAALAPLHAANEFETKVTVDGKAAVTSAGRSVGGGTQLTVTTSGKAVDYIQLPPQAWARQSGAAWVLITVDEAPGSPLGVLATPTTLAADPSNPASLVATYPALNLGLAGDPVTVTITLGNAVTFHYEADTGGHKTVSETTIRPSTNRDPIKAPI
jgi:hypothetical protein